jgi:hypothetical protein
MKKNRLRGSHEAFLKTSAGGDEPCRPRMTGPLPVRSLVRSLPGSGSGGVPPPEGARNARPEETLAHGEGG